MALMTKEEKLSLASRMFNPIRCGGAGYDENGKSYKYQIFGIILYLN